MRVVVFLLLLLSASSALAQAPSTPASAEPAAAAPAAPVEDSATPPPAATNSRPTREDIARHVEKIRACIRQLGAGENPVRNNLRMKITIGPDGMILGDPEAIAPVDSEGFRKDVASFIKRIHECEPFKVGSSDMTFTQEVNYLANRPSPAPQLDEATLPVIRAHFRRCWTKSQTGADIVVRFNYNRDGTYARRPLAIPRQGPEYSEEAAVALIEQLSKCPTADFPPDKYDQWASFRMVFRDPKAGQNATPASSESPPASEQTPQPPDVTAPASPSEPPKE